MVGCSTAATEPDQSETVEPVDTAETASATVDADGDGFDTTTDCDDSDADTWPERLLNLTGNSAAPQWLCELAGRGALVFVLQPVERLRQHRKHIVLQRQ